MKLLGYETIGETARQVIKDRSKLPLTIEEIKVRQIKIFQEQKKLESVYNSSDFTFLDRSLIDVIAYCNHLLGYVPDEIKVNPDYSHVFILERLPFQKDEIRIEKDDNEAEAIYFSLLNAYRSFSYNPIFVPVLPIRERAELILNKIGGGK